MKIKRPACSTGHGTGVTPPIELGTILARDKARKFRKKTQRVIAQARKLARHQKSQLPGGQLVDDVAIPLIGSDAVEV